MCYSHTVRTVPAALQFPWFSPDIQPCVRLSSVHALRLISRTGMKFQSTVYSVIYDCWWHLKILTLKCHGGWALLKLKDSIMYDMLGPWSHADLHPSLGSTFTEIYKSRWCYWEWLLSTVAAVLQRKSSYSWARPSPWMEECVMLKAFWVIINGDGGCRACSLQADSLA